jgi:hypothetical protein
MAKLPPEFVKTPAPAPERKRKAKKTSIMTAERARDLLREVVLRLGDEERAELDRAREELRRAGEELTLEQMVYRVVAEWCSRRIADRAAAAAPVAEGIVAQLRRLADRPLRTWRELGAALRRLSPALLG